jgi:hypothetical protein
MFYKKNFQKKIIFLFCTSFFLIVFTCSNVKGQAQRIDLDFRYKISDLKQFSKLSEFLKDKSYQQQKLNKLNLILKNKPHELFIDEYYDNSSYNLYRSNSALRYRSRYKNTNNPIRNIHFKELSSDNISYNENKLKVKKNIENDRDFINYLMLSQNNEVDVITNLKNKLDIKSLKHQFTIIQDRDRYYFNDKDGLIIYTVSLDRTLFRKDIISEVANFIEFELNELVYVSVNDEERKKLISTLSLIINDVKDKFDIEKVNYSKYQFGFKNLKIDKKKSHFNLEKLIVVFSLIILCVISILIFKRKPRLKV